MIPQAGRAAFLERLGKALSDAGVVLLEYRIKTGSDAELLAHLERLGSAETPNIA